jgi:hypothetical protein
MHLAAQLRSPPWRERLPSGELGEPYGPSPATFALHVARWKNWAFRIPSREARQDADIIIAFVRLEDGSCRVGIPSGEFKVYTAVFEQGHSIREAARQLGLHRSTVKTALKRLRARVIEKGEHLK